MRPHESFVFSTHLLRLISPPFVDDFRLETEVALNWEAFVSTLACSPHLFSDGPLGMVYQLLQNSFVPDDFMNGFDLFFEVCRHIARSHVPPSVSHFFFTF